MQSSESPRIPDMTGRTVCVTGATGYVASWVVKRLLDAGATVHATVRDPKNQRKTGHLLAMDGAQTRLTLFQADLLRPGSFTPAMQGCETVIHTASPFFYAGIEDPARQLVTPAKEGTRNVLESVNATASVTRVVLTSSVAAIYGNNVDLAATGRGAFVERDWNTTSTLDENPYSFSKTEAEKVAWQVADGQSRWTLVCINPGFILGPSLTARKDSTSIQTMIDLGAGQFALGAPKLPLGVVDVRDVAEAHVRAAVVPEAHGRHITVADTITHLDMGRMLTAKFGKAYPFPRRALPKFAVWLMAPSAGLTRSFVTKNVGLPLAFDNTKSKRALGLNYRPLSDTLCDHFEQVLEAGLVPRKGP